MNDDKPFVPVFGPNGAVMNAPTMTDEVRDQIEATKQPWTWQRAIDAAIERIPGLSYWACFFALFTFVALPWMETMQKRTDDRALWEWGAVWGSLSLAGLVTVAKRDWNAIGKRDHTPTSIWIIIVNIGLLQMPVLLLALQSSPDIASADLLFGVLTIVLNVGFVVGVVIFINAANHDVVTKNREMRKR